MKHIIAVMLLVASSQANAWGQMGLPNPVTWGIHAVLGFGVAWYLDKHTRAEAPVGVTVATSIGILKEISDVNFDYVDAFSWGVGAAFYHYQKDMITCPDNPENWYTTYRAKTLEECAK